MDDTLSVAEVATLLNVTRKHVLRLITDGKLPAITGTDGTRAVDRADAEAYGLQARKRARKALEELARVSQEAGLYKPRTADDFERSARRWRRRKVQRGEFLSAQAFCRQRGVSPAELRRLGRRGDVFGVEIAHRRYYPAVLASVSGVQLSRLDRLCRRLRPLPAWLRWDTLTAPRGSLGDRSVMQSLSRGARYRRARWFVGVTVADHKGN
ncbi:helix-turn-helix domain-containing protein [Paraburkholderia elongata]|nr:helix-turn-helix domain-containing protein [Paraburkholderia elongata]